MDREKPSILIFCFGIVAVALAGIGLLLSWWLPPRDALSAMIMRGLLLVAALLSTMVVGAILPEEPCWWDPVSWITHGLRRLCRGPLGYVFLALFAAVVGGAIFGAACLWWFLH